MADFRCAACELQFSTDEVPPVCPNDCATEPVLLPAGDPSLPVPDPGFVSMGAPVDVGAPDEPPPSPPVPVVPPHRCCGR